MIFPEQLDDRSFRLFVERVLTLQKNNQTLSNIEQQLADLLHTFPELGFQFENNRVDRFARFENADLNPYLLLSAIWEVQKQIQADSPKGIKKIIHDYYHTTTLSRENLYHVAELYLDLYLQGRQNESTLSEKEYLWEIYETLHNRENTASGINSANVESLSPGKIKEVFAAVSRELHDEASLIKLTREVTAKEIYEQLPLEWIKAMSKFWQLVEHKLKRDDIKELVTFFNTSNISAKVAAVLDPQEKKCLAFILANNNEAPVRELTKVFGQQDNDGFWWTHEPPTSTLGLLRLKGLLVVGEKIVDGESLKIAMIPEDLINLVQQIGL